MEWKLKTDKAKMYRLISEYLDVPKIGDTYFSSFDGTYWMEYYNRLNGHYILTRLSWCNDKGRLSFSDLGVDSEMRDISLSFEEMLERGLLEEAGKDEGKINNTGFYKIGGLWLMGCVVVCFLAWLVYRR